MDMGSGVADPPGADEISVTSRRLTKQNELIFISRTLLDKSLGSTSKIYIPANKYVHIEIQFNKVNA